ncbi:MAG: sugar phosphate isomerase/epimerase [Candidatus Nezhaarchaeota archaeon]|nr:sugar phosphate isomerase/epimerase [Candidatus Nezhaarchaeota archaeon]
MRPLVALPVWPKAKSIVKALEKANEYGFDYVEASLDYPWPEELRGAAMKRIKEAKEMFGLKIAIHAPWRDIALASPRQYLREAALRLFEECLKFSAEIEAMYFNIHVATHEAWSIEEVRRKVEEAALASVKQLAAKAREVGIRLTIENNPEPLFGVPSMLKPLLEIEGVKLCLDVGHVAYANWVIERRGLEALREETSLEEWVKAFRGKVLVGHLHDYIVGESEFQDHLLLGAGEADVKENLELLLRAGCEMLLLEVHWASRNRAAKFNDLQRALKAVAHIIKAGRRG